MQAKIYIRSRGIIITFCPAFMQKEDIVNTSITVMKQEEQQQVGGGSRVLCSLNCA